jgi:hypothetical protein
MNKATVFATLALTLFLLSCGDNSVNINGQASSLYCDFGPVTQYGGGCFEISDASECDTQWGEIVSVCSDGSGNNNGGTQQTANAVIITLTYWETKETDGLLGTDKALDPKISFNVIALQGGRGVSANSTSALLDADNVGQTWSGSKKSSPIPFASSADELQIHATVIEKDPLANDDISPGYYTRFYPPFSVGRSGSHTLDYGNGKSKVSFNYEFVKQ